MTEPTTPEIVVTQADPVEVVARIVDRGLDHLFVHEPGWNKETSWRYAQAAEIAREIIDALDRIASTRTPMDGEVGELIERLRERYTADEVPPCRVCGEALSIQRAGGGEPTIWGCSPYESDPENPGMNRMKAGRDLRGDDHYSGSRWTQYRDGDSDVLALLSALTAYRDKVERLEAAGCAVAGLLKDRHYYATLPDELVEQYLAAWAALTDTGETMG